MENNRENHVRGEEINLMDLFESIGRLFKKLREGLIVFFSALLHVLVVIPYFYIKKYRKLVYIFVGLAFIMGLIVDGFKSEMYSSEILITPNYDSGKELYTQIEYLNSLIDQEKIEELASVLGVDTVISKSYKEFKIDPNYNERIFMRHFAEFSTLVDTSLIMPEYEAFKSSFKNHPFDFPQQKLEVIASRPEAFKPLNNYFKNLFNDNELFNERRDNKLMILKRELEDVDKSIAELDSLRKAVNTALTNTGNGQIPGGNIILNGAANMEIPEAKYNIFQEKNKLLSKRDKILSDLKFYDKLLVLNSEFPDLGEKYNPVKKQFKFILPLGVFIIFLMVFYLIHVGAILERRVARFLEKKQ